MDYKSSINEIVKIYNELLEQELSGFIRSKRSQDIMRIHDEIEIMPDLEQKNEGEQVVVSLTTIKSRLDYVYYPIMCMFLQSKRPNRIVLWLGNDIKENMLPEKLIELREYGLEIRFVEDIGPHTKYFYALQEFENDCVITIDDDMLYQPDLIEGLLLAHRKVPEAVCTYLPLYEKYTVNGIPYPLGGSRFNDSNILYDTSEFNFAQGVCGVLYPPSCIEKKYFDKSLIRELCPKADDIWLYATECLSGIKVVNCNDRKPIYLYVEETQKIALRFYNEDGGNDRQFKKVFDYFGLYEKNSNKAKIENEKQHQVFIKWIELLQLGVRSSVYLKKRDIKEVSIYGLGRLGKLLVKELLDDGIKIVSAIDQNEDLHSDFPIYSLGKCDVISECIIVTPPIDCCELRQKYNDKMIISIEDIFVELKHERIIDN